MRTPQLAEELEAVLVSGSATRRTDILNRVTDLFIYGAARYSPEQVDLFGDVMVRLLHGMEAGARRVVRGAAILGAREIGVGGLLRIPRGDSRVREIGVLLLPVPLAKSAVPPMAVL